MSNLLPFTPLRARRASPSAGRPAPSGAPAAYPVFLRLAGRPALVVGGGRAAAAKVRLLVSAGAEVTVVAPRLGPELAGLRDAGRVAHVARGFVAGDVRGRAVVHGATGIEEVDDRVFEAAVTEGVPVNVVDRPERSTFEVPAIVDRAPVTVAISTGGRAPALARQIRETLEALLPARLGALAGFAAAIRDEVRRAATGGADLRALWRRILDGPVGRAVLAGREAEARQRLRSALDRRARPATGRVAIVGAGPGDPELLTLRALRLLQGADVVVYDRLVSPAVLDRARREARLIDVGKRAGDRGAGQDEINALLARHAAAGAEVVRLKGGDPFVFGRGGEELAYLRRRGIPVEVVPGITAATGCAAAAGMPLTRRGIASAVTFVTGHGAGGSTDLDWSAFARGGQTLVIYMGLAEAGRIAARLIAHGLSPATPALVVEKGTTPAERIVPATVGGLEDAIAASRVAAPALIVIGEVAALADVPGAGIDGEGAAAPGAGFVPPAEAPPEARAV